MILTEDNEFKGQLIAKIAEREFTERTGIHSSDVNYCLNKSAMRKLFPLPVDEDDLLLFSMGWSTQRWLTGKEEDAPSLTKDGITVTCDVIKTDGSPWELKSTYQSSKRPITDNTHWFRQIMAQCFVTGATSAHLSRLEIMGDWSFPKKGSTERPKHPTLHAYRLEFTPEELARNWEWMQERKGLLQKLLDGGELLPKVIALPPAQEYECERCPRLYREYCEGQVKYPALPKKES